MESSNRIKEILETIDYLLDQYRHSVLAHAFCGNLTREWREQDPQATSAEESIDELILSNNSEFKLANEADKIFDLPQGWKWITLADLLNEGPANGYSPKSGVDATGTLSLKLSATTKGFIDLSEATVKRLYEVIDDDSRFWLISNDLLIQRANSLEYVGASAIFQGPSKTYIYPDLMMRVRIKHDGLRHYIWRYLNSTFARSYFRANATGTAGNMPKINKKTVNNLIIPVPPKNELLEINQRVDHAMALSDGVSQIIVDATEKLQLLNQSTLSRAFRGELVPQDPGDEPSSVLLDRIKAERDTDQHIKGKKMAKKVTRQKRSTKIIPVVAALKTSGTPLSAQNLLLKAGYPNDATTDQLEEFFLDVREELKKGTISCIREVNDDIFTLVE